METPQTRYVKTPDGVYIAYQTVGDGPFDLVYEGGWMSNVDAGWELPDYEAFLRELAARYRLITFDRRGTGLSDRPNAPDAISLEKGVDDTLAVLDEVGSERPVLFGFEDGAIVSSLIAATNPDRCAALVLFSPDMRYWASEEYPWGWTEPEAAEWVGYIERAWGTPEFWAFNAPFVAPGMAHDDERLRAWARYSRFSGSPGAALAIDRMQRESDGLSILPSIHVPALVMHREGNRSIPVEAGRYVASKIPGAEFRSFPGDEHAPFRGDTEVVLDALDRFVAGIRDEEETFDRVLATVMFTDIVGSTERAAELGDRGWRDLVERHHATVRAMLARYRGVEMDTAGDGFFATFDGPARAVRCAQRVVEAMRPLGVEVRVGLHTGEVETIDGKAGGIAVTIGARVASNAGAAQVLTSQTVKDLTAGSGLVFEDAGEHELKGVPDRWHLYRVVA